MFPLQALHALGSRFPNIIGARYTVLHRSQLRQVHIEFAPVDGLVMDSTSAKNVIPWLLVL